MSEYTNTVMVTFSYKTFCSVDDFQSGLNEAFREGLTAEQWVKDVFAASFLEWTKDEDFHTAMVEAEPTWQVVGTYAEYEGYCRIDSEDGETAFALDKDVYDLDAGDYRVSWDFDTLTWTVERRGSWSQ